METPKTFIDYYEVERSKPKPPTHAALFVARIAAEAKVTETTVRGWLSGRPIAPPAKALVAKYLKADPDDLFPNQ